MKFSGALTLSTYHRSMVEIVCQKCGRAGRYRRSGLIERHGPDITLPDLLRVMAQCERYGSASDPCQVVYQGLSDDIAN